jgi:hypothetical protein
MGLDFQSAQFLLAQKQHGIQFGRSITLGRQSVCMDDRSYNAFLEGLGRARTEQMFADDFFRGLGAATLDFMDASGYEGANIIHDLNQPIPDKLKGSYDCVFDGGALEHVFNFPTALKNCMEMTRVGGHLIIITTWNNFAGHGFYQFSPELFYAALTNENGFASPVMLIVQKNQWFSVASPRDVGMRVELINDEPTLLFLVAQRETAVEPFAVWPQQSDYSTRWDAPSQPKSSTAAASRLKDTIVASVPGLAALQKRWRQHRWRKIRSISNRRFFRPAKLD